MTHLLQDAPVLGVGVLRAVLELLHEPLELPLALMHVDVGTPHVRHAVDMIGGGRLGIAILQTDQVDGIRRQSYLRHG